MDPRISTQRKANLSDLMLAKTKAGVDRISFCPFGCGLEHCDDHGYCKHLVGFSADKESLEPMRVNIRGVKQVFGGESEPVQPGDQLVRITTSYRVYRREAKPEPKGK